MRVRVLLLAAAATGFAGCVVPPIQLEGRACDEAHPCEAGYTCVVDRCLSAPPQQAPVRLRWPPPALTEPTTVEVSQTNRHLDLDPARDYVVVMPQSPLRVVGGLTITGGRNVVLIGGTIEALSAAAAPEPKGRRALYLKNQHGTIHVEGLHLAGADLDEGIDLDQRDGAIVQLQNIRVETVRGSAGGHHARILHTWGGPRQLRVDRFTGYTEYQGMLLEPNQFSTPIEAPEGFELRHVDLHGTEGALDLYNRDRQAYPLVLESVWADSRNTNPSAILNPAPSAEDSSWEAVELGTPPGAEFVPAGAVGIGYQSPGYE